MSQSLLSCVVALALLGWTACGGNPSEPSGAVRLRGTLVGDVATSDHASLASEQAGGQAGRIIVAVQENGLTTTVGGDGTFELEGVPEGGFTLLFTRDGAVLGTIEITGALPGQEIRITVRVTGRRVALVAIEHANGDDGDAGDADDDDGGTNGSRTCAISGGKVGEGIELEGNVDSGDAAGFELRVNGNRVKNGGTVRVNTAGASFKCNGKPTATECRSTVKPSAKVHVRGNLNACDVSSALEAASQVMVQKP